MTHQQAAIHSGASSRGQPIMTHCQTPEPDTEAGVDLKQLKEELTCSICLEICIRPCSTPCGHSFCRSCLREALRHSPKCPKCREVFAPGFELNVNTALWNTIRMLFPKTNDAPASPPESSPIRRATDRRHLRHILTAEAEALRRIDLHRAHRDYVQYYTHSRIQTGDSNDRHRRRRTSPQTQDSHGDGEQSTAVLRGRSVLSTLGLARHAAGSVGGSQMRSERGPEENQSSSDRSSLHGVVESPTSQIVDHRSAFQSSVPLNTRILSSNSQTTTNESSHREDNNAQETLSSSEYSWIRALTGQRRGASGIRSSHGFGAASSLNRSASYGDLQNDVEYVTVQSVQRLEQVPLHRRRGVFRFENHNRDRFLQQFRRNRGQQSSHVESASAQDGSGEFVEDPDFEEEDFDIASDIVSDRDSSFTSSIVAPVPGSRANSFRFREDPDNSQASTTAAANNANAASAVTSFAGFERLYDISSQIEAAMNDIERLSIQPGWSRQTEPSQPPATPLTHRSCFQLSDDEEEDIELNARIRDTVFILDDVETESESDEEAVSLPVSPFGDVDDALHHVASTQWLSSVEDSYSYY